MLAAAIFSVTHGLLTSWNRSRDKMSSANQATLALDQLVQDLESLVIRTDGNTWLAVTITDTQRGVGDAGIQSASYPVDASIPAPSDFVAPLRPGSKDLRDYRFGHLGVWLRFFTVEPDSNTTLGTLSTVRAVAYQLARVPVDGANEESGRRYFLHRSSVRGGLFEQDGNPINEPLYTRSTFTTGYDIVGNNAYNNPDGQDVDDPYEPGTIRRPIISQVIASDVIDFGVRVYCQEPDGTTVERFPADRRGETPISPPPPAIWAFLATTSSTAFPFNPDEAPAGLSAVPQRAIPVAVEVMLRVLTDEGARLIGALERGDLPADGNFNTHWWRIAEKHSDIYSRRIDIRSHPL